MIRTKQKRYPKICTCDISPLYLLTQWTNFGNDGDKTMSMIRNGNRQNIYSAGNSANLETNATAD